MARKRDLFTTLALGVATAVSVWSGAGASAAAEPRDGVALETTLEQATTPSLEAALDAPITLDLLELDLLSSDAALFSDSGSDRVAAQDPSFGADSWLAAAGGLWSYDALL